jgi:hypothetical protein
VNLFFRQADAVIAEHERGRLVAARRDDFERDLAEVIRLERLASADGIDTVLQQLAQEHLRTAVEVIREQVDDAA